MPLIIIETSTGANTTAANAAAFSAKAPVAIITPNTFAARACPSIPSVTLRFNEARKGEVTHKV
jgi:hypothetical protein